MMRTSWDEKYAVDEYVFGKEPNVFFKEFIDNKIPGKMLLPAEGEGRNAVYAAQKGWETDAFDVSVEGFKKAMKLASEKSVSINYFISDIADVQIPENEYDVIALIFCHLHSEIRNTIHQKMIKGLKSGGFIVLQSFSQKQLPLTTGGPKDIEMLYNTDILALDFSKLKIIHSVEKLICLDEGPRHSGWSENVLFIAQKF